MSADVISTAPKPFVFVLMPFDASFNDTYALGIRPACEDAGAYCERVDEQIFQESILQRIYNQISKADVIVADMTDRNANVFYETGYAHALSKHVILLTQDGNDIPFDLKHYPHIIYGGSIAKMKQELERRVRWCIESPNKSTQPLIQSIEIYANGVKITNEERGTIYVNAKEDHDISFELIVALHNSGNQTYQIGTGSNSDFAVVFPKEFRVFDTRRDFIDREEEDTPPLPLPDGRALHIFGPIEKLPPDAWVWTRFYITSTDNNLVIGNEYSAVARIYTEVGPRDAEFYIILKKDEDTTKVKEQEQPKLPAAWPHLRSLAEEESQRTRNLIGKVEGNLELMRKAFDLTDKHPSRNRLDYMPVWAKPKSLN